MVWPPSVRGILVTEGVRGEGGVLKNSAGKRFMFEDIPDLYRNQTADNPDEGWRYVQGDRDARRPPELLTRDHVARCIVREIRAGRGSPHGGVFLDIAWIAERMPKAAEHIRRKLPSMYHQFKELAGIDITAEPMEVGPTTHYVMGGIRIHGASQMSTVPGLFAAGECAAGLHGANRLGGNSLSDLLVFGCRAGAYAAAFATEHGAGTIDEAQVRAVATRCLAPLERNGGAGGEGGEGGEGDGAAGGARQGGAEAPYAIQHELQGVMQDKVGIVRNEGEMREALAAIGRLRERAAQIAVPGNRHYNPGWHTALDVHSLLTVSEAVALSALERKESRGAHFREDCPGKSEEYARFNHVVSKGADGRMTIRREPVVALSDEQRAIIAELG
jgi:succinate dehydrogenase / fumarate reductase flavoprotein subunit